MGFINQLITGGAHVVGWRIPHDLNMKMDGFRTMPNSGGGLWCLWCLWVWAKWSSLDAYWSATDARCQLSNGIPDVHVWYGYVHMSICILYTCNSYTARLVSSACERPLTLELYSSWCGIIYPDIIYSNLQQVIHHCQALPIAYYL